jgi:hypothetical protein
MDTSRIQKCLANAEWCEVQADEARQAEAKYALRDIARQWRAIAKAIREVDAGDERQQEHQRAA